ncbi:MAG: PEGA domain-containing protein [Acidobacteriales bacterium]|nr:PEGA domain-containing protein [Candidatus Koribacter versatilis]MBI3645211.1 PEGA domain-containing protein [Terriglobales bacterium]
MKRVLLIVCVLIGCGRLTAADSPWQYGRIADVRKSVTTKTKAWVVNTPITEDEIVYTISVHVLDKILVGNYELTPEGSPPPEEWTTNYPLRVQVVGDNLYLRAPTGDLRLHIVRRKNARPMMPLTADEKKSLEEIEAPPGSLVGFSEDKSAGGATKPAETAPPPPPLPPTTGTVNVRSTPYLSEVFVDGDSMGYTPAKINLPPGKHTFRVEKPGYKPWTKEMMITIGSELTLDASLEKK